MAAITRFCVSRVSAFKSSVRFLDLAFPCRTLPTWHRENLGAARADAHPRLLWAAAPEEVALLLSGGVDSSVALRLLDAKQIPTFDMESGLTTSDYGWGTTNFRKLGLPAMLTQLMMNKNGLILFVGGTGSGKSTFMAHCVQRLREEYDIVRAVFVGSAGGSTNLVRVLSELCASLVPARKSRESLSDLCTSENSVEEMSVFEALLTPETATATRSQHRSPFAPVHALLAARHDARRPTSGQFGAAGHVHRAWAVLAEV